MAKIVYNSCLRDMATGDIDFNTDSFKIMLQGATYHAIATETKRDSHETRDDLTDELSGTGYTAGGQALASVTVTLDTTNNIVKIDCADPSWTGATIAGIYWATIYKDTGTASTDRLVCGLDVYADNSNAAVSVTNGTFTITMPANGFLTIEPKSGS